jgi:hypothetical protein
MTAVFRSLMALAALIVFACNQNRKMATPVVNTTTPAVQLVSEKQDTITVTDSISSVVLHNGAAVVKGHLNGVGSRSVIEFEILESDTLQAQVKPVTGTGNVRINQIQLPDKSLDGPFGQTLTYPLKKTGTYKLIIGEDMMAEGNWKGDYVLTIHTE